jgi:HD-GYP domain-containing protein (c-di-GMP phosphodiesterase class II)
VDGETPVDHGDSWPIDLGGQGGAERHEALAALVDVVELHDASAAGHSRRVATLARDLALRLGASPEEAGTIERAGLVHDLGKLALDPAILRKPGPLTEAEWAEVRRHPDKGAAVVARYAVFGEGHRLVRHHHEAWDGSGYPDRLQGEAIPFGARILAVADAFDVMTHARPYRSALPIAGARAILRDGAGKQRDPRVVEALFAYLDEIDETPLGHDEPPGAARWANAEPAAAGGEGWIRGHSQAVNWER